MNRKDSDGYIILTNTQKQLITQVTKADFEPDLFGTLTFSNDPFSGQVNTFNKGSTQQQHNWLNFHISKLMSRLNQCYYGRRWHKKMLADSKQAVQIIMAIESHNLHYHYHFVAQTPKTKGNNQHEFRCNIQDYWHSLPYCHKAQVKIDPIWWVDGAVAYILSHT